jgi:hypothetical protein
MVATLSFLVLHLLVEVEVEKATVLLLPEQVVVLVVAAVKQVQLEVVAQVIRLQHRQAKEIQAVVVQAPKRRVVVVAQVLLVELVHLAPQYQARVVQALLVL